MFGISGANGLDLGRDRLDTLTPQDNLCTLVALDATL
jgi:hypothetical protein